MRIGGWAVLAGFAVASFAFATPASACAMVPIVCVGSERECNPSEAERLAEQRRLSAAETRRREDEAQARLRSGGVDFAAELAELLIPNVRPVNIEMSDCGPMNEVDYGEGRESVEALFARLVEGTALAGSEPDVFWGLLRREAPSFGDRCNAEFRRGFADFLQRSVAPDDLRRAWLFLAPRQRTHGHYGVTYHRLMSFEPGARTPPVRWMLADRWLSKQVQRYVRRKSAGRAVAAAVDAFWAERAAQLADDGSVCPNFIPQWQAERASLVAQMTERLEQRRQRYLRTRQQ